MQKIFQAADLAQQEMSQKLIQWANINTYSENLPGLQQFLQVIKIDASSLNASIEEVSLPPRKQINSKGESIELPSAKALIIKKNPGAKKQLLFGGHLDTVYPLHCPFQKAELLNSNTLNGPGVADMKGGLIIMLQALTLLENSPYRDHFGYEVILNPDEEVGSTASESLYKKAAKDKIAGLIFEPSFSDGSLVSSRKGSLNFTLCAYGRAAHAGRDFEKGRSAIVALSNFIVKAHRLNESNQGIHLNFGSVEGGGPDNIVPDFALCHINARFVKPDDQHLIKSFLNELTLEGSKAEGIKLLLHEISQRGPKPIDEKTEKLFDIVKKVGLKLNQEIKFLPTGGVSDGNILASVGLPTIDTLGVIGGHIHTFSEYALLDSLKERVKLTVSLVIELIG